MRINISGIRVAVSEEVSNFIHKKIEKLNKYFKDIISSHIILKAEKGRYEVEVNLRVKGMAINGKEITDDLYASIEGAIDKVSRQSKKYKEKRRTHKSIWHRGTAPIKATGEEVEPPAIVEITRELAKPMGVDEAAMQLNLSKDSFLVFLNAETNQVNVIYKKRNGYFGLIQPE